MPEWTSSLVRGSGILGDVWLTRVVCLGMEDRCRREFGLGWVSSDGGREGRSGGEM